MKKIIKPGILAGIAMLIVGMTVSYLLHFMFPSLAAEYNNTNIFRSWSDPLMSLYFLYPFTVGLILAWVWQKTKSLFKGSVKQKGVNFGLAYWLVSSIPGMLITYSSFKTSFLMVLTWLIGGLVNGIVAGLIFVKMDK